MNASVIMPCHNAGAYIAQALRSAAAQTDPPHEIIVIDDASTDDSIAKVESSGVPVRLLRVNARNAAAARNAGIAAATGDWIAFLDADDLWYPTHLANAAKLLDAGQDVAYMANHHFLRADGSVQPIPADLQPKLDRTRSGITHLEFVDLLPKGFHFGHSTVMLRLDRVREVGGFDETQQRRHDMDLWLRVLRGRTWAWCQEPAAQYRIDTPGSISKSVINAEYFFLRALLKNLDGYPTDAMRQLVRTAARRSVSLAFVDGRREDYDLARRQAWPHLPASFRLAYGLAGLCPGLLRGAIRAKRGLTMGQ